MKLDSIDFLLLSELQSDSSQSNQALAEKAGVSAPTCMRRVARLTEAGLIERRIALLSADRLAPLLGHGLQAVAEVSLDRQDSDALAAFERKAVDAPEVQQCYRVSPGPDFVLVLYVADMPAYQALAQRLFTTDANVRNVKTFFTIKRAKFAPHIPLAGMVAGTATQR